MATSTVRAAAAARGARRRFLHRLSTALMVLGVGLIAYAAVIYFWGDPVTALYTGVQQRRLEAAFDRAVRDYAATPAPGRHGADPAALLGREADRYARSLRDGQAFARLDIDRIGLSVVVVNGTDWADDLSRGPGRYPQTAVPGQGKTVAIAGHRTTFGKPFRHIDDIRDGDRIVLELPYATFTYRVERHRIVDDGDWSIIRPQGYDRLILSACHPLYSSAERWVVFARAASAQLASGERVRFS